MVLGVLGVIVSIQLLEIHYTVSSDPLHPFSCRVSETVDCNAVAQSPQSMFMGVPVPIWSIVTYSLFVLAGAIGFMRKKSSVTPFDNAPDYALVLALWSVGYSAYLAYISAFVLKTLCINCAALYAINLGLIIACLFASSPLKGYMRRRAGDVAWIAGNPIRLGLFGFALVIVLGGLIVLAARPDRTETIVLEEGGEIDLSGDPMIGTYRAPVTIIEFSDFECPACRSMHPTIKELLKNYEGQIRFYHKNYPLDSKCNPEVKVEFHKYSCDAAFASECAHKLGKYEDYTDLLWMSEDLSPATLVKLAETVGMNAAEFNACMTSDYPKGKVLEDIKDGEAIGLESTPTFLVNNYKFSGARPYLWCSKLVKRFLKGHVPEKAEKIEIE